MSLKSWFWKMFTAPSAYPVIPATPPIEHAPATYVEGQVPGLGRAATVTDERRVQAMEALRSMGARGQRQIQALCEQAAQELGAPVSYASLMNAERIFFLAHVGLSGELDRLRMADRRETVCQYVVNHGSTLAISDAHLDPLLCQVPSVQHLGFRAYLGEPIRTNSGFVVGSFCTLDFRPRLWRQRERAIVRRTAQLIAAILMPEEHPDPWASLRAQQ